MVVEDRAVVLQPGRDFWRGIDVRFHQRLFHQAVRQRHQVGQHLLAAVAEPEFGLMAVVRQPDCSARPRARTADGVRLLEQANPRATRRGAQRGRQAGRAGPQHHDVVSVFPHALFRKVCGSSAAFVSRHALLRVGDANGRPPPGRLVLRTLHFL
jgi:hypothetical protein